jgi:hypothetical protein
VRQLMVVLMLMELRLHVGSGSEHEIFIVVARWLLVTTVARAVRREEIVVAGGGGS